MIRLSFAVITGLFTIVLFLSSFTVKAQYTLPAGNYAVLPVKYVYFSASPVRNTVYLKWTADNEVNHSHFDIERSFDGRNFLSTGIIVQGFDNGITNKYEAKDAPSISTSNSTVFYRLKNVDVTGIVTFSNVAVVKVSAENTAEPLAMPSPFTNNLSIHFSATHNVNATIRLQRLTGETRLVKQVTFVKGSNQVVLAGLGDLQKGIYITQLLINGTVISYQKIIKC